MDFSKAEGLHEIKAPKFFDRQDGAIDFSSNVVGRPKYKDQYLYSIING